MQNELISTLYISLRHHANFAYFWATGIMKLFRTAVITMWDNCIYFRCRRGQVISQAVLIANSSEENACSRLITENNWEGIFR